MTIIDAFVGDVPPNFQAFPEKGGLGRAGSFMTGAVRRADGEPFQGEVCLREASGAFGHPVLAVVQTNAQGEWEITGLPMDKRYRVEIRDPTRQLNGAVLDWIQPVPM